MDGARLTPKQQEALFTQLHLLEARAVRAQAQAQAQAQAAEEAGRSEQQMLARHNLVVSVLQMLDEVLHIRVHGDLDELLLVEDRDSGQVLARNVPLLDAYRTVLLLRLGEAADDPAGKRGENA